jgi:hypothetical protein
MLSHEPMTGFDVRPADKIKHHVDSFSRGPLLRSGLQVIKAVADDDPIFKADGL